MRRTALLLLAACITLSGLTLVVAQTVSTKPCVDNKFLSGIDADLDAATQKASNVQSYIKNNSSDSTGIADQIEIEISALIDIRHRYEDLTVVPECEGWRTLFIQVVSNTNDEASYLLMQLIITPSQSRAAQLADTQNQRISTIAQFEETYHSTQQSLQITLANATITPTKSNARITFTPGGKLATKVPVATKLQQIAPTKILPTLTPVVQPTSSGGSDTGPFTCADGTVSHAAHRQGACSSHGGVAG